MSERENNRNSQNHNPDESVGELSHYLISNILQNESTQNPLVLSFAAQNAFAKSLDSLSNCSLTEDELLSAFVSFSELRLHDAAWSALPAFVDACIESNTCPAYGIRKIQETIQFEDPKGLHGIINAPLITYLSNLMSQFRFDFVTRELHSLYSLLRIDTEPDRSIQKIAPHEIYLKAANAELNTPHHQQYQPDQQCTPLEGYYQIISNQSLTEKSRTLFLALLHNNNEQGKDSVLLRSRFAKLVSSDDQQRQLSPRGWEFTQIVCNYYMRMGWPIEPLLPVLSSLQIPKNTELTDQQMRKLRDIHSQLCSNQYKFESLSSKLFLSPDHNRIEPLSSRELNVLSLLTKHLPTESPHAPFSNNDFKLLEDIKKRVLECVARLVRFEAKEPHFIHLERIIERLPNSANNLAMLDLNCFALEKRVRLIPLQRFLRKAKLEHIESDQAQSALAKLDEIFNDTTRNTIFKPTLECIEAALSYSKLHGKNFTPILEGWLQAGMFSRDENFWLKTKRAIEFFSENNLQLYLIFPRVVDVVDTLSNQARKNLIRFSQAATLYIESQPPSFTQQLGDAASSCWRTLFNIGIHDQYLRMVERQLKNEKATIPFIIDFLTRDLPMYALTQKRISYMNLHTQTSDPEEIEARYHKLATIENNLIINDHPPHRITDEKGETTQEARTFHLGVLNAFKQMFDVFNGFSALRTDCKSFNGKHPAIVQYAIDCALKVSRIHASTSEKFPGSGYLISGLLPGQLFVPDQDSPLHAPGYNTYKKAWPRLAEQIDHIAQTQYLLTRGLIAVIPPDLDYYRINKCHYSYLVFNEHFSPLFGIAILVPTNVLKRKIQHSVVPFDFDEHIFHSNKPRVDINSQKLLLQELERECKHPGSPILNVGWGSNLSGGFCNAFPPGSAPYHQWERRLRKTETTDDYGHVHKSHRFGGWQRTIDQKMAKFLETMKEADMAVRTPLTGCQNLFELFQIGLAYWHRGFTLPRTFDLESPDTSPLSFADPETDPNEYGQEQDRGDASARMLIQAYDIHNQLIGNGTPREDFPVLCITDANKLMSPTYRAVLDTLDLRYFDGEEWQNLPKWTDGTNEEELRMWQSVLEQVGEFEAKSTLKDLRWKLRSEIPSHVNFNH